MSSLLPRMRQLIDLVQEDLTISDTPPSVTFKRKSYEALCGSEVCVSTATVVKNHKSTGKAAVKAVSYGRNFCPDCDFALFWTEKQ